MSEETQNKRVRYPDYTYLPKHLSFVFKSAQELTIPKGAKGSKYLYTARELKVADKNGNLSYPLQGLNHAGINDKQKGRVNFNYTHMENLAVHYGVPLGVLLTISRAMAEIQYANTDNIKALIDGLTDLCKTIDKESGQAKTGKSISDERRKELAEIFLNAYKKNGLQGKGPDFISEVKTRSTTSP